MVPPQRHCRDWKVRPKNWPPTILDAVPQQRSRHGTLEAVTAAPFDRRIEITDVIWAADSVTGARVSVDADSAVRSLRDRGQIHAAKLVATLPAKNGCLDDDAVDQLLWRVHTELQRLSEELQMARRVEHTIASWVDQLRRRDPLAPIRILDVGCGLGYVTRWLAKESALGESVEYVGIDQNSTLINFATSLAEAELAPCRFLTGDAFTLAEAITAPDRTIVISTGVLHHLADADLERFFSQHQEAGVAAFAHWDTEPGPITTVGAWIFHRARMRQPVSRHDGVLSARRAYPAPAILRAASACDEYTVICVDHPWWRPTLIDVLRPVTGTRRVA